MERPHREPQAAFKCKCRHFDSETTPRDRSLVFKTDTQKPIWQLTGVTHREAGVGTGAAPSQSRDSYTPHSMSWAGGLQVCPGNLLLECAGGAIQIIILHWTLTC